MIESCQCVYPDKCFCTDAQRREALIQAAHKLRMDGRYMQAALVSRLLRATYAEA